MLDKEKVRLMTELAFYEQTYGKEDFKINEFYRNDYAGFHTICSVIWVTIGYVCVVALGMFTCMDWILANISKSMIVAMIIGLVIGYLALIFLYGIIANLMFRKKHKNARERMKEFNFKLTKLLKMYEKEKR